MQMRRAVVLAALAAALVVAGNPVAARDDLAATKLAQAAPDNQPITITPGRSQRYDDYQAPQQRQYDGPPARSYEEPPPDYRDSGANDPYAEPGRRGGPGYEPPPDEREKPTFSMEEITEAGHRFFGRVSMGLARVIEYAFQRAGRPNGYILGEEAGGAFVAGLRYGEGMLYTKDAGEHKVYWQGPSIGYDFGAEGSKTMVLVYNLRDIDNIYTSFAGVDGSAYFIGGVGITFLSRDRMTLAPIRSGVGLRLGANIGYLKYTPQPTWNPF